MIAELTRMARELLDPAWFAAAKPNVEKADAAAGLAPTLEQLDAQIEDWRTEQLAHVFAAMEVLQAPEHLALIFQVASDQAAPLNRREAALRALDAFSKLQDAAAAQQHEALRKGIAGVAQPVNPDPKGDLTRHVAEMREPFRLCFQEELARDPTAAYRGKIQFRIEPNGVVAQVSTADFPDTLSPCLEAIVRAVRFEPAAEPRVVQVPLTLDSQKPGEAPQVSACLPYEPGIVSLSGTLVRLDFPGPPNYESIEHGDARETTWLLRLDRAACTEAGKNDNEPARLGLDRMQLVFLDGARDFEKYRPLMGKHVTARGTLFHQLTGHHHTEVLLTVSELAAAK